ncbi:TetR/AcrR family transcriptional regulator [Yinghuangia seranimata]|uniref:TetR/AcrR family transcriptional regulator n=1 Tax=Yinghuangia seranimata TaxID=408067 RepID=UPI00248B6D01|nr:TetR/AcrR family transcriptional regulator [Yinghuangia seranimata]MDI2132900.1 helix-turn-helix domain-containing protein [Yinghuangia seranimata]
MKPPPAAPAPTAVAAAPQRARILATALTLMSSQGFAGTSMRTLATACELNVATLYHYFPSKADLLRALVKERAYPDRFTGTPPVDTALPPRERLVDLMTRLWQAGLAERELLRLVLSEGMRGEELSRGVGGGLTIAVDASIARWLAELFPELPSGRTRIARLLRALLETAVVDHLAVARPGVRERYRESVADLAALLFPGTGTAPTTDASGKGA